MSKLADATKQVEAATRDLQREQNEWHVTLADLKREKLQLTTANRALEKKKIKLDKDIKHMHDVLYQETAKASGMDMVSKSLSFKVEELESKRADKATELADLQAEVKRRKATINSELEEYSIERKLVIKNDILATNEELEGNRGELRILKEEAERTRQELATLNQAAIQEQEDLKVTKSLVDQELLDKQEELTGLLGKIDTVKSDLQKLLYDRDNAIMTIAKAKEEHEKFVEYERKARKILDTKDKELIEQSVDIAKEAQLLTNKRSFLPPL